MSYLRFKPVRSIPPVAADILLIIAIVLATIFANVKDTRAPFHPDENYYLKLALVYYDLLLEGNWSDQRWHDYLALDHPLPGRYIFALVHLPILSAEESAAIRALPLWDFQRPDEWNVANGALIPDPLLMKCRAVSSVFVALTALIVYATTAVLCGRVYGFFAAALLIAHPLAQHVADRATPDALLVAAMTLVPGALIYILIGPRGVFQQSAAFIILTLSLSTSLGMKLTGLLSIAIALVVALIAGVKVIRPALLAGAAALLSLLIDWALSPALWQHALDVIKRMFAQRREVAESQQVVYGDGIFSLYQAAEAVAKQLVPASMPLQFAAFALCITALCYLALQLVRARSMQFKILALVIGAWSGTTACGIIGWLPLNWPRYFYPLLPPFGVLAACGIAVLMRLIFKEQKSVEA